MDQLLFFTIDQDDGAARIAAVREVEELASRRSWIAVPPAFVGEIDGIDEPAFGAFLTYPSANKLSTQDDLRCLADVEAFIGLAEQISRQFALYVECELNGESIGVIENGNLDRSLRDGLLGEWRAALA